MAERDDTGIVKILEFFLIAVTTDLESGSRLAKAKPNKECRKAGKRHFVFLLSCLPYKSS
jgi:hypothetical protein